MKKSQQQYYLVLDAVCVACAELRRASIEADQKGDFEKSITYEQAANVVSAAVDLIDPSCNPKYIVKVKMVKKVKKPK